MDKQYFEAVPVSSGELPENSKENKFICIDAMDGKYIVATGFTINLFPQYYSHWFRPVDLTSLISEKMAESWDTAWDHYSDDSDFPMADSKGKKTPNKEQFLNSIKL